MKKLFLIILLGCAICQSCINSHHEKRTRESVFLENGQTLIAIPKDQRKRFGYDSIQLLVDDGKITANFCYQNAWMFSKDTVYTDDTTYRLWGFKFKLTPEMYLTMKDTKHAVIVRDGHFDMTKSNWNCDSVTIDSFKIKITKVLQ